MPFVEVIMELALPMYRSANCNPCPGTELSAGLLQQAVTSLGTFNNSVGWAGLPANVLIFMFNSFSVSSITCQPASNTLARAQTSSMLKPYSRSTTAAGAEAPKHSTPSISPCAPT
jgi:hypothetical protein